MEREWLGRETRREEGRPRREEVPAVASREGRAIDEPQMVRRCQAGEEYAFRELMRRYRGRAVYLATQILRDPHEAEDVAQEAFLRVFRSIRKLRAGVSFNSWLYRIVVNLCLDRRRRAAPPTVSLEECTELAAAAEPPETRLQIDALLSQLSEELRVTLLLRVTAQLSYAEIARELRVSVGTVGSRLNAAREQLRALRDQSESE